MSLIVHTFSPTPNFFFFFQRKTTNVEKVFYRKTDIFRSKVELCCTIHNGCAQL